MPDDDAVDTTLFMPKERERKRGAPYVAVGLDDPNVCNIYIVFECAADV
jgi:hypothetical protein